MNFYDNTKYAFIVAIIRSYESKMLTHGDVERMVGAKNAQEAYRVFNDLDYARFLGDANQIEEFQTVINEGLIEIKNILIKDAPYKELLDILWLKYDFSNLKSFVKAKIQEKDFDEVKNMFVPYAKYSFEELKQFFSEETSWLEEKNLSKNEKYLEETIKKTINSALSIYAETENPIFIDSCIDKAFYEYLQTVLPDAKNSFVNEYYELEIDLKNIRTYLRVIILEKTELFEKLYLQGGKLGQEKFSGNFEEFLSLLEKTNYFDLVKKAIEAFVETKSFLELEQNADVILLNHMLKARYINLGIEPLFAFFWIKENNAQVIRTIMVNKLNNLEPAEIRKKIRKLYQ